MPFNGAGVYSPPGANFPAVANTLILSNDYNTVVNDIATALSGCMTKDGQTVLTANIPFNNFRLTGLAAGTARTDAAQVGQVQDSGLLLIGTIAGTANAVTGNLTPAITAYVSGQMYVFIPTSNNSGPTTIAINGLAAKNIYAGGLPSIGGELRTGIPVLLEYDGTQFNVLGSRTPMPVTTLNMQSTDVNSTGGGGACDLMTYTVKANTLNANNKCIRVTAFGKLANNANAKGLIFDWGSTHNAFGFVMGISNPYRWVCTIWIVRTSASNQRLFALLHEGTPSLGAGALPAMTEVTDTQTDTADIILKFNMTVSTTASDIVQEFMLTELMN